MMTEAWRDDDDELPTSPTHSIHGSSYGTVRGVSHSHIGRDVHIHQRPPDPNTSIDIINSNDDPSVQFDEFRKWPRKVQTLLLSKVMLVRAATLIDAVCDRFDHVARRDLLRQVHLPRLVGILARKDIRPRVAARILDEMPEERARQALKQIATIDRAAAARLVELLTGWKSEQIDSGLDKAHAILRTDIPLEFLADLGPTRNAVLLLAGLPPGSLLNLLDLIQPNLLGLLLVAVPDQVFAALAPEQQRSPAVIKVEEALNQLKPDRLKHLLVTCAPIYSTWFSRIGPHRLVEAMNLMEIQERLRFVMQVDPGTAVEVLRRAEPSDAVELIERAPNDLAIKMLYGLSDADGSWLGQVLGGLPRRRLLGQMLWIAMFDGDAGNRLGTALPEGWVPQLTGWPVLDATLLIRTIAGPVVRHLFSRRGSAMADRPPGTADFKLGLLWSAVKEAAGPPDYKRQRNHLAVILAVALLILGWVVIA